jgi:hypothetical protein
VRAAAVDEALDPLVVVHSAVDQLDHEVLEEPRHLHRGKAARDAGRCRDGATEREVAARLREVGPLRARENRVLVDVLAQRLVGRPLPRRLAHVHGLEAPVVARVQRRRLDKQDRDRRMAAWILDVGVEVALESLRLDQQVAHRDAAGSPRSVAPRVRVEALLVQLTDAVGARVGRHRHLEVLQGIRPGGSPHVRGRGLAVLALDRLHDLDVVAVRELAVGLRLEQVLHVEVVERAHDRPARDGRDHLDRPQQPELREPRKDADVEEGGAVPTPGEGEAELRLSRILGHRRRFRPYARSRWWSTRPGR